MSTSNTCKKMYNFPTICGFCAGYKVEIPRSELWHPVVTAGCGNGQCEDSTEVTLHSWLIHEYSRWWPASLDRIVHAISQICGKAAVCRALLGLAESSKADVICHLLIPGVCGARGRSVFVNGARWLEFPRWKWTFLCATLGCWVGMPPLSNPTSLLMYTLGGSAWWVSQVIVSLPLVWMAMVEFYIVQSWLSS